MPRGQKKLTTKVKQTVKPIVDNIANMAKKVVSDDSTSSRPKRSSSTRRRTTKATSRVSKKAGRVTRKARRATRTGRKSAKKSTRKSS